MSFELKNFFSNVLKGVLLSVLTMLCGILLFAVVVKLCLLSSFVIKGVNQFLKAISLFIGCFFCVRGKFGLVKGSSIGLLFALTVYLLFALLGGKSVSFIAVLLDVVFGIIVGSIFGIMGVNRKTDF